MSVRVPLPEVGRAAAGLLLQRLGTGERAAERLLLPTIFIPRGSIASARSG